jgi:hypothetical protein
VQESGDTGEKIEHPWGQVNQLVYSAQHRGLQTLGDFAGLGEFISLLGRNVGKLQTLVYFAGINHMQEVLWLLFENVVLTTSLNGRWKALEATRHGKQCMPTNAVLKSTAVTKVFVTARHPEAEKTGQLF